MPDWKIMTFTGVGDDDKAYVLFVVVNAELEDIASFSKRADAERFIRESRKLMP